MSMISARKHAFEEAAKIADFYAEENALLAGDMILMDPILSGRDATPAACAMSKALMMDRHMHVSMDHAAQYIAAAIRLAGEREV